MTRSLNDTTSRLTKEVKALEKEIKRLEKELAKEIKRGERIDNAVR